LENVRPIADHWIRTSSPEEPGKGATPVVAERARFGPSETKEERAERVTVSLPAKLADYLRGSAESRGEAVSAFMADALRERQRRELAEAMMSGLLEDAEVDRQTVREWDATLPDTSD
jgi:hypothetical protein